METEVGAATGGACASVADAGKDSDDADNDDDDDDDDDDDSFSGKCW